MTLAHTDPLTILLPHTTILIQQLTQSLADSQYGSLPAMGTGVTYTTVPRTQ